MARYRRRNPASTATHDALVSVESDLILIGVGVGVVGLLGYLLYQKISDTAASVAQSAAQTLGSSQTQSQAAGQVWGYPPSPSLVGPDGNTPIPNPSQISGGDGLTPWVPSGPAA